MNSLFHALPLGVDPDSPEGRQHFVDGLNRFGFTAALKDGVEGLSVVRFDEAKARLAERRRVEERPL